MTVDQALLSTLEWRCIGPYRGGRVVAVAGDPSEAPVFYTCGGIRFSGRVPFSCS